MKLTFRLSPSWVAVLACIVIVVYAGYTVVNERANAITTAGLQTQSLVRVLEEHARQTLHRVATTLAQADATLEPLLHEGVLDTSLARQRLSALLPADRLIQNFLVLDRAGALALSILVDPDLVLEGSPAQDYFVPHVRGADRELVFGKPAKTADGQWLLPVSRRTGHATDAFDGVLVAMVRLEFLQSFYDSIDHGQAGFVTLFLSSGAAVVTLPTATAVMGEDGAQSPLFREHLPAWPTGTVREVATTDGVERLYSYRALNDYPVVVAYGLSLVGILNTWQQGAWRDGMLLLTVVVLLVSAAIKLKRQEVLRRGVIDKLKASELHLRTIIETEPECILIVDALGRLVQINPAGLRMVEADTFEQVAAQPLLNFIAPEYRAAFTDLHQRVLAGSKAAEMTFEVLGLKDGHRWLESYDVPMPYQGRTVHLAVIRDITEHRRNEMTLALANTRMATLINSIPDALFFKDAQSRLLIVNEPARRLFQLDSIAWEGKTELELAELNPGFRAAHQACFLSDEQAWIAGGLSVLSETVIDEQGHRRHFEVRKMASYDAQGARQALFVIGRDVTELKIAEGDLRIAAIAFESQQGMVITDTQRVILRVNKAFTAITGYSADEVVGKTPRLMKSGHHDSAFYAAMAERLELEGSWQGEIWNRRKSGDIFPEWLTINAVNNEEGIATHYVAAFADISEHVMAQAQIERLAFYDPLTQLPNRRLLIDRLDQALKASVRHVRKNALLLVDLDNFKTLNDTLGHAQGDLLLRQVALRLKLCIRDGDTVARLGGDEFLVMIIDLSEDEFEAANQAEMVGDKILAAFRQDYVLTGGAYHSTPSIGVTLFGGERHEESEEPLKRAELAMFQAKADGRNTLRFFEAQMQATVSASASLEADLHLAIQQQQFVLCYQAQVVGGGRISGVEALLRWQHPQRGLVSPAQFIPVAEASGLILPIGQWVLDTACAQLAAWASQPGLSHLTMAVNVSSLQFHQVGFVDSVLSTLEKTHAKPKRLKLELTESMLAKNVEDIIAKMDVLKAHGVGFSLDDFGTGYSSLSYLKRLPLDQLKIDQSFVKNIVTDPNDAAIAKMVIALAESLGLAVIAEGVELQAQADFLAHQGCHAYQGYLFSRPLAVADFEILAREPP